MGVLFASLIAGVGGYLWRAFDHDGEVVDVYLQKRRDGAAAKRFFKRLLKMHRDEPRKIVTDKLRSYIVAHRELIPDSHGAGVCFAHWQAPALGNDDLPGLVRPQRPGVHPVCTTGARPCKACTGITGI